MGQKGRLSRVFSLSFSPIAYSSIDRPSAKGQFSIQEISLLKQILGGNDD
jgi:3-dehydroquinate dehydratase-1